VRALLSNDTVVGVEPPSKNADRNSSPDSLAMIATNGDVSLRSRIGGFAAPHSLHVQNGEVMVAPACARPTLGIDPDGTARIDDVRVRVRVDLVNNARDGTNHTWFGVHEVNMPRVSAELVLYTPRYGPTTLTEANGTEVILSATDTLRPKGDLIATVLEVHPATGNTALQAGQMVLSARGSLESHLKSLVPGEQLTVSSAVLHGGRTPCGPPAIEDPEWSNVTEALGGNYWDAHNSVIAAPSASAYPKGSQAHPRTSVGLTADGHVLMVVVDGRQPGYSIGVTLAEMGQLMLQLGATDAVNLDGGGSTVMAVREPGAAHITVSDRPSDGRERSLTQALAAFSVNN
jgi:hypothetical protein